MLQRFLILAVLGSPFANAYSVLSHEAIIDAAWEGSLKPVLEKRFPGGTLEELNEAHSYAYGGAIIQDMGYYPFGSRFFSDLAHYVRTGDFIEALLKEAQTRDEYAFALGSMAHYSADNDGHSIAINRVVPMLYPKLRAKYGPVVSYADDPAAHLKTEFAFDVVQVASGQYAPDNYHSFIGFSVAKPVLERAFKDTYGIEMKDAFASVDLALGTFRFTVGSIIPKMTRTAWAAKKKEIVNANPGTTKQKFVYNLSRSSFHKDWGQSYQRPGFGARFLAVLFRLIPKIGPFKALAFHAPTADAEKLFMDSFNMTLASYRTMLGTLKDTGTVPTIVNDNFDTGRPVVRGEYKPADAAYAKLREKLQKAGGVVDPELHKNIDAFYAGGK